MSRHEWKFEVSAAQLADACHRKEDYHTERLHYWEDELERAENELLATGIEVKKQLVTGGMRRERTFDSSLKRRCNEAEDKIDKHKSRIEDYGRFQSALNKAAGRSFELTILDWEFFGL